MLAGAVAVFGLSRLAGRTTAPQPSAEAAKASTNTASSELPYAVRRDPRSVAHSSSSTGNSR